MGNILQITEILQRIQVSKIYEYLYFEAFSIKLYKYIIKFIYKPPKRTIRIFRQKYYVIVEKIFKLSIYIFQ